jgi:hypothetical protein
MAPFLLLLPDYFWDLNWFGPYDRDVFTAAIVLMFVGVLYLGPTIPEMKEHRARQKKELEPK